MRTSLVEDKFGGTMNFAFPGSGHASKKVSKQNMLNLFSSGDGSMGNGSSNNAALMYKVRGNPFVIEAWLAAARRSAIHSPDRGHSCVCGSALFARLSRQPKQEPTASAPAPAPKAATAAVHHPVKMKLHGLYKLNPTTNPHAGPYP